MTIRVLKKNRRAFDGIVEAAADHNEPEDGVESPGNHRSANAALDQYIAYVNTAEANISRRGQTNRFYQTVTTSFAAVIALLVSNNLPERATSGWGLTIILGLSGFLLFILGRLWAGQLLQHRRLSSSKYAVLHEMEKHLPFSPFKAETEFYNEKRWRFGMVASESIMPLVLSLIGLLLVILAVLLAPAVAIL